MYLSWEAQRIQTLHQALGVALRMGYYQLEVQMGMMPLERHWVWL